MAASPPVPRPPLGVARPKAQSSLISRRRVSLPTLHVGACPIEGVAAAASAHSAEALAAQQRRRSVPMLHLDEDRALTDPGEGAVPCGFEFSHLYRLSDERPSRGSVGAVRSAWRRADGLAVALKEVSRWAGSEEAVKVTRREYEFMSTMTHPSLVRALAIHETPTSLAFCMEYCDGGSLESYVAGHGAIVSAVAVPLAKQILEGLDYLHGRRIVHRDIKPDNLLLCGGTTTIKIGDFNSAKQIGDPASLTGAMLTDRGTRLYNAPELLAEHDWNERVDLWSCGLSVCFMLLGHLPFDPECSRVRKALRMGCAPPMDLAPLPGLIGNLVQQCLEPDPRDRPPAVELLAHPAFLGVGVQGAGSACAPPCGLAAYEADAHPGCGLLWRRSQGAPARLGGGGGGGAPLETQRQSNCSTRCGSDDLGSDDFGSDDLGLDFGSRWSLPSAVGDRGWALRSPSPADEPWDSPAPSEEPSPHCDKSLVWRQLAQRRFEKTAGKQTPRLVWGAGTAATAPPDYPSSHA